MAELERAQQKIGQLQEALLQKDRDYFDLEDQLKELRKTPAGAWERKVRALEKDVKRDAAALLTKDRELKEAVSQETKAKEKVAELEKEVNALKEDKKKAVQEAEAAKASAERSADEAAALKDQAQNNTQAKALEEAQAALGKAKEEAARAGREVEAAREARGRAEAEARTLREERAGLDRDKEEVEAELGKAKQALADVGEVALNEGGSLTTPAQNVEDFVIYFRSLIQTKNDYQADSESWEKAYRDEVRKHKATQEKQQQRNDGGTGVQATDDGERAKLRREVADLKHTVASLQVDKATLQKEVATLQAGITTGGRSSGPEAEAQALLKKVEEAVLQKGGSGPMQSSRERFELKKKVNEWDVENDKVAFEKATQHTGTATETSLNNIGERVGYYLAFLRRWAGGSPVHDAPSRNSAAPATGAGTLRPTQLFSVPPPPVAPRGPPPGPPPALGGGSGPGTQQAPSQQFWAQPPIVHNDAPDSFYQELPEPWNQVPDGEILTETKYVKLLNCNLVRDFTGKLEEYPGFRLAFHNHFHRRKADPALKFEALKKFTLKVHDRTTGNLPGTAKSYALLIKKLEDEFGGHERIVSFHLDQLKRCRVVQQGALKDMEELVTTIECLHQSYPDSRASEIQSLQHVRDVLNKLSPELVLQYRQHCQLIKETEYNVERLLDWLKNFQIRNLQKEKHRHRPEPRSGAFNKGVAARKADTLAGSAFVAKNRVVCPECEGDHALPNCPDFLKKNVNARRAFVYGSSRCLQCLAKGHRSQKCQEPKCPDCGKGHHKVLHGSKGRIYLAAEEGEDLEEVPGEEYGAGAADEMTLYAEQGEEDTEPEDQSYMLQAWEAPGGEAGDQAFTVAAETGQPPQVGRRRGCALRYVVLRVVNPHNGKKTLVNTLVDGGASITTMSERAAKVLDLKGRATRLSVQGFGGAKASMDARHCRVEIQDRDASQKKRGSVAVVQDPAPGLKALDWTQYRQLWPHLDGLKIHTPLGDGKVDMILGTDWSFYHRALEEKYSKEPDGPVATRSHLGWTVAGPLRPKGEAEEIVQCAYAFHCQWDYEWPPPPVTNADDRAALNIISASTRRLENGKLEVAPLWKGEARPPNNYHHAAKDWNRVEKRLEAAMGHREAYHQAVQKMEKKGFIEEIDSGTRDGFFLTHFPVVKESNATTKVRVVMNGAASHAGSSLNDHMHSGPKTLNSLVQALLRFRRGRYAVIADVEAMFLNISMPKPDRKYHRMLYRKPGEDVLRVYENCGQVFGSSGSPCISVTTVKLAAMHLRHRWPDAAAVVLHSSIVDDNLGSCDSTAELQDIIKGLQEIYRSCGMTLHKWACNEPSQLPDGVRKQEQVEISDSAATAAPGDHKPLGVYWDSRGDYFTFKYDPQIKGPLTKLKVLKGFMGLFDPLGFLLPVVMQARILYRDLWETGTAWEERVSEEEEKEWRKWFSSLADLQEVRLPRRVDASEGDRLVVFCDASVDAYGACAYLVQTSGSSPRSRLLFARGRVNSSAAKTIPKLELMAAQIGVKVGHECARALERKPESIYYFTDSMNTLVWIRNPGRHLEAFTARKAHQIREASSPENWNFVPTDANPADLLSRGVPLKKLLGSSLWCVGPEFLTDPETWPRHGVPWAPCPPLFREEEMSALVGIYTTSLGPKKAVPESALDPFPNFERARRATVTAARCANWWRQKTRKAQGCGPDEWRKAASTGGTDAMWALEQSIWASERAILAAGKSLPAKHAWSSFDVQLQGGVMKAGGRLRDGCKPIVHHKSRGAELLARHIHEKVLKHAGGQRTLMAEVRLRIQVQGGKALARRILRTCVRCQRNNPRPGSQLEGPLPLDRQARAEGQTPFSHILIDEFGPVETKAGRGKPRNKRWVLVASCAATRAVHLELLASREAAEVASALARFAARRAVPKHIHSDNAKEFHATAEGLKAETKNVFYGHNWSMVKWTFSPALAPHWAGAVEASVKLAKAALKAIHNQGEPLNDLDYNNLLIAAEELINRRPLGEADEEILTPAHFTLGRAQGVAAVDLNNYSGATKSWREVKRRQQELWQRLQKEVVPSLQARNKWKNERPALKIDQLVLVKDVKSEGPYQWALGKIERAHNGRDGRVRSYTVRVGYKNYERAVTSLAPLLLREN